MRAGQAQQKEQAGAGHAMEKQTNFGGNQTVKSTTQNKEHTGQNARPLEIRCVGNLSVREYFAGLAMQGLLACGALTMAQDNRIRPFNEQEISDLAFHMADAIIAEGNK